MSKREIASLACKILGLYMIIQGINVLANVLSISIVTPNQIAPGSLFSIFFSFIFLILFGILIWFLSDKLSAIMVTGEKYSKERSGIEASEIQRVSFSVLGLFFIGNSLPKLVSTSASMYSTSGLPNFTTRLLIGVGGAVTQLIIGLCIFLGSQVLVNFLNSIRHARLKREDDSSERE